MRTAGTSNFILLLVLLFASYKVAAQEKQLSSPQAECQMLIDEGTKEQNNGKYPKALELLSKAEALAERYRYTEKLCIIKNGLGNVYRSLSNYGEALGHYQQALKLATADAASEKKVPTILNNIALIYLVEKDYNTSLGYLKQAYTLAKKANSHYNRTLIALNISDLYNKTGEGAMAQVYLKEVETLPKSDIFERGWKINYAESLFLEGNISEAQIIVEGILKSVNPEDIDCYVCITELLSRIHNKLNNTALAVTYAKQGLLYTYELDDRIRLYDQLSTLYTQKKEYPVALQYKDSVLITTDSLAKSINRGLFESNKIKLKLQEFKNEMEIDREKHIAERNLFIVGLVLSLLLFFFIYRNLKSRIEKQKQEKIIADNEKKIFELELDNLKNSVAEKNRKLSAKALYLSGRNELIDDVITSLSAIPEVSNKKEVADYLRTLRAYIKTDEEWDDFITYFEQVNPEFIKTLNNKFPELNAADIRFLCYVYMNLEVKEIGNIYNITYNAAVKRLRRIREKMHIDKDISLHEYLVSLH